MGRRSIALALAAGLFASACQWNAWTPGAAPPDPAQLEPSRSRTLALDEAQSDEIVCAEGFCQQWYRLDVPRPGTLRIRVTGAASPEARIVLHDGLGHVLARANNLEGRPLAIDAPVEGNVAAILVQSGQGRFPYTISVSLE